MKIMIVNDDGIYSPGILALAEVAKHFGDVTIVAPDVERSSMGHAVTHGRPLSYRRTAVQGFEAFRVDGTPADSVYVALCSHGRVLPRSPDLVVSGINHGLNLAGDVFYSGTVAAAREAALRGFRGLALSAGPAADLAGAAACGVGIARAFLAEPLPRAGLGVLLNVNFPPGERWPIRATRLGQRRYEDAAEFRTDPRGGEYLWLGGSRAIAIFDLSVIDGIVNGIGRVVAALGAAARQIQTGRVQGYGLALFGGFAVIALVLLFTPWLRP